MRRLLAGSIVGSLLLLTALPPTLADAPLCALAPAFVRHHIQSGSIAGAAVYDLRTGTVWSGGHPGPYALHSMIKPPLAWAVMTDAHEQERELTDLQREALFYMVAWSQNPDVNTLLGMIGGLPGLNSYYERWGVPVLAELQHQRRWGSGRAKPGDLAQLYAALALSTEVPEAVRDEGLDLLRAVVPEHRWGASIPKGRLIGWESLIKTGNFTLPEPLDEDPSVGIDPRDAEARDVLQARDAALEQVDTSKQLPWFDEDAEDGPMIRMNSAAIWLDAPWQGSEPRFVIAIMQETQVRWARSRALQNQIGAILADAVAERIVGRSTPVAGHCLKRALY